jgi:hypothetical protein
LFLGPDPFLFFPGRPTTSKCGPCASSPFLSRPNPPDNPLPLAGAPTPRAPGSSSSPPRPPLRYKSSNRCGPAFFSFATWALCLTIRAAPRSSPLVARYAPSRPPPSSPAVVCLCPCPPRTTHTHQVALSCRDFHFFPPSVLCAAATPPSMSTSRQPPYFNQIVPHASPNPCAAAGLLGGRLQATETTHRRSTPLPRTAPPSLHRLGESPSSKHCPAPPRRRPHAHREDLADKAPSASLRWLRRHEWVVHGHHHARARPRVVGLGVVGCLRG